MGAAEHLTEFSYFKSMKLSVTPIPPWKTSTVSIATIYPLQILFSYLPNNCLPTFPLWRKKTALQSAYKANLNAGFKSKSKCQEEGMLQNTFIGFSILPGQISRNIPSSFCCISKFNNSDFISHTELVNYPYVRWNCFLFLKKKSKSKAFYCLRLRSEHNSYHYHHFLPRPVPWRWHGWWWNAVGWHWSYYIVCRCRLSHSWFGSRVHDLIPG